MELTKLTREEIKEMADTSRVSAAGEEYALTGMIFRFSVTPTGISASVHGHYGDCTVPMTPAVKTRCTCSYEGSVCKHVVAVLLHYPSGGYSETSSVKRIYLRVFGDPGIAAQYIVAIRKEHSRRPALREEFAGL